MLSALALKLLLSMLGPISGLIANRLMNYVDDVKQWTAKLPDVVKQSLVIVFAAAIPILNAQFGISLPSDPSQLLTQPYLQAAIAAAIAFLLKGHQKQDAASPPKS